MLGPIEPGWADIENKELVFLLVEDFFADGKQAGVFGGGQFAEENAELDVLAVVLERFEQAITPAVSFFGRAHIVGAEVEAAVVFQRTTGHDHLGMSPRSQRANRRAWMRKMVRQEQR